MVSGTERTLYFAFHDEGYIRLAPFDPLYRNIAVNTTAGSKTITTRAGTFSEDMLGQYIFIEGQWKYIGDFNSSSSVDTNTTSAETKSGITTNIATLNFISVVKASDAAITRFEMICMPEVR